MPKNELHETDRSPLTLRPFQAMCIVCALGEGKAEPDAIRLRDALRRIRSETHCPVALRCNAGDTFSFQDTGTEDDAHGSAEVNRQRDLEILRRLSLAPGTTLPARMLFLRLLKRIETTSGLCGDPAAGSDAWRGCPKSECGYYSAGRAKGIAAIIPPRDPVELAKEKMESMAAMETSDAVDIKPHLLICAVAQYGADMRPPFDQDNLPELIQRIIDNPDTRLRMVPGADWMMCGPCPSRAPEVNGCAHGIYQELKDLNVLKRLGLTYGSVMNARELYQRLFERVQIGRAHV